jgi:tRNA wybutosine-synthesizing protein 3
MSRRFDVEKSRVLYTLYCALEQGAVDSDAIPLLVLLNAKRDYYTTSSCSGRVQLAATPLPGEKRRMVVLAKWHRPIETRELKLALLSAEERNDLWLSVQGPILHVACRDQVSALHLLLASRRAGLKHSGILWIGRRVMVELTVSDRIETPLRLAGINVVSEEHLDLLVERVNAVLLRAKGKLRRLEDEVARLP